MNDPPAKARSGASKRQEIKICLFDLRQAHAETIFQNHPFLSLQAKIDDLILGNEPDKSVKSYLGDLNSLARLMQSVASPAELAPFARMDPGDLEGLGLHTGSALTTPLTEDPLLLGALFSWADQILTQPDLVMRSTVLHDVLLAAKSDLSESTPSAQLKSLGAISPVVESTLLASLDPHLRVRERLAYRSASDSPTIPSVELDDVNAAITATARVVPQMVWSDVALVLAPDGLLRSGNLDVARAHWSAGLCLVGQNAAGIDQVFASLGLSGFAPRWRTHFFDVDAEQTELLRGLIELRDLLAAKKRWPIDYGRRRRFDYGSILPIEHWQKIAYASKVVAGDHRRHLFARRFLIERLTGSYPPSLPTSVGQSRSSSNEYSCFRRLVNVPLLTNLDRYASIVLEESGVRNEPVVWRPTRDAAAPAAWSDMLAERIVRIRADADSHEQRRPHYTTSTLLAAIENNAPDEPGPWFSAQWLTRDVTPLPTFVDAPPVSGNPLPEYLGRK